MRETDIILKEILVRNVSTTQKWIEFNSVISIRNTNHTMTIRTELDLPQEMAAQFFKKLRKSQKTPVSPFFDNPSDFIQVIRFSEPEIIEKKVLNFFRTIWHDLHHLQSHRSLTPKAEKIEEIRNMRLRL
jgi:hypothetical protein